MKYRGIIQIWICRYLPLAEEFESFWSEPPHRLVSNWLDHSDINSVMLATSLDPEGYFGMMCC